MKHCIYDRHLVKKINLYCLNKFGSRELYQIQTSEKDVLKDKLLLNHILLISKNDIYETRENKDLEFQHT